MDKLLAGPKRTHNNKVKSTDMKEGSLKRKKKNKTECSDVVDDPKASIFYQVHNAIQS